MEKRQSGSLFHDDSQYYTPAVYYVKWAVLTVLILLILLYFVGGYLHARRRMRQGLAPMLYHRWFIPRRERAHVGVQSRHPHEQFSFYHNQHSGYNMQSMPPPAYNQNMAPPPLYQPPLGGSKVDPSQHIRPSAGGSANIDLNRELPNPGPAPAVPAKPLPTANTNPFI